MDPWHIGSPPFRLCLLDDELDRFGGSSFCFFRIVYELVCLLPTFRALELSDQTEKIEFFKI